MTTRPAVALPVAARRFRALSDHARLRIVALMAQGEWCVCELAAAAGLPQPLVSYHLRVLGRAGFLHVRREGRWHYYALNGERLDDCVEFLQDTLGLLAESARLGRRGCSC